MGRYVTPHGVEIEMNDKAAAVVGYKPAKAPESQEKKPAKRAVKKSDEKSDD